MVVTTTKSVSIVNNTSETAAPVTITAGLTKIIVTVAVQQNSDFYQLAANAGSWSGTIELVDTNSLSLGSFTVANGTITQNVLVSAHDYFQLAYSGTTLCIDATLDPVRLGDGVTYSVKGVELSGLTVSDGSNSRLEIEEHGRVTASLVSSGGSAITSGGTFSGGTCAGGAVYVMEGGVVEETGISSNGYLYVNEYGSAHKAEVSAGGMMIVNEDGIASKTVIANNGSMVVSEAAISDDTEVRQGGSMTVTSGGTATATTVSSGGVMVVSKGSAQTVQVASGGCLIVSAGATVTGASVADGGLLTVVIDKKTSVTGTVAGQAFSVSGQNMQNFTITSGCSIYVNKGSFNAGTVGSGGFLRLGGSGTAADLIVKSSGTLYSTGSLTNLEIMAGAETELTGGSLNGTVTVHGTLGLSGNVTASGVTQFTLDLSAATPETSPTITSYASLSELNSMTIKLGDNQSTGYYLIADSALPLTGGYTLLEGSDEYALTIDGSPITLDDGYSAKLKSTDSGLQFVLLNDQETPEITIYGDLATPQKEITVYAVCWNEDNADISYRTTGSEEWLPYDADNGLLITANGTYYFRAEDDAGNVGETSIIVSNIDNVPPEFTGAGENTVTVERYSAYLTWKAAEDLSGISHYELLLNGETYVTVDTELITEIADNGIYTPQVRAFDNAGNASSWMLLPDVVISVHDELNIPGEISVTVTQHEVACSWQAVELGETSIYYEITLDGDDTVYSLTNSYTFTDVASGDHVVAVRAYTEDASGAWKISDVFEIGKTDISLIAASDSKPYDGSALSATTYNLSGTLDEGDQIYVTVSGSQLDAGSVASKIATYQVMHGETDVTGNYNVSTFDGLLTVTQRSVTLTSGDATKVYDGTPLTNDTVTVSGDGFVNNEGVDVTVTGSQTEIGTSSNSFNYTAKTGTNLDNYLITKVEGTLEVTAKAAVPAKSDVDGNGISDVMFQWTGGDHQIGFWMNGSSTWQGTGASQPSNWTLLGNYDMDQNGKADQVMFGNVEGGAYVGFYKDGDTADGGWSTIGFLSNPNGIEWRNAIGNLTGTPGANSIVWHAPELGVLGVWTDGTNNWVSIPGDFNANWEMQGCGDFNGDGKDEVLFTFEGNLYSTDIDGNFAVLGQGVNGWDVCAIGDFSGDGQDDVVLFHTETGSVMKFENGTTYQSVGQLDASDWFICGAGDYDNDQKDDLLVRQNSTGMLGYYSSGNMTQWHELGRGVDMAWTVVA